MAIDDPKGNLVTPVGMDPSGNPKALLVNVDGALIVSAGGGGITPYRARVYMNTNQDIVTATITEIDWDVTVYDPESMVDLANNMIVVPVAGYYSVKTTFKYDGGDVVANKRVLALLYINDVLSSENEFQSAYAGHLSVFVIDDILLAADDEITVKTYHTFGANAALAAGNTYSHLTVHRFAEA